MYIHTVKHLWFHYLLCGISPKLSVKFWYRLYLKKPLDLEHPKTLDEKIQWMKLYYYKDNPLVYQCADKFRVRDYVKNCGLEHILNDLIATYHSANEINWDVLPQKFVLKWNFSNGGNIICSDKSKLDRKQAIKELNRFQKIKPHLKYAEPQYDVEKVLLCEKFIETQNGEAPVDYKFYCFNGEAKYVLCCYGRSIDHRPAFYFFDKDWQLQRFNKMGKEAPEGFTMPKPEGMDDLFHYAEILSKPFPFVRADFYLENGKAYFGELTFTPGGGYDMNRLPETQLKFGQMVNLPPKNTK
jgi:hypothetical protein